MRIQVEHLEIAIQGIVDNPTIDYPEIVTKLNQDPRLQNYDVDEILLLFLQALSVFWSKPTVGKWNVDQDGIIPYSQARDIMVDLVTNKGVTVQQLANDLVESVATVLMKARLEPVHVFRGNEEIYTATSKIIERLYDIQKQLDIYESAKQERYAELDPLFQQIVDKYHNGITDANEFKQDVKALLEATQNRFNLVDYFNIIERIEELTNEYNNLIQQVV